MKRRITTILRQNDKIPRRLPLAVLFLMGSLILSIIATTVITGTTFTAPTNSIRSHVVHDAETQKFNTFQDVAAELHLHHGHEMFPQQPDARRMRSQSVHADEWYLARMPSFRQYTTEEVELRDPFARTNAKTSVKIVITGTPIRIDGNADFAIQAAMNGWPGNGTPENPYVIADLVIVTNQTGTNAIEIRNTNVYFVIRNCTVTAAGFPSNGVYPSGLYLYNVTNARLEQNTASYNYQDGIFVENSKNITSISNTASYNYRYGIFVDDGVNNTFISNNASYNGNHGISLLSSVNNTFINNIASHNNGNGIYLAWDSDHDTFINNIASYNAFSGFSSRWYNDHDTFINNTASHNDFSGFFLKDSEHYTFINNTASHNANDGISLWDSGHNILINNTISHNAFSGVYLYGSMNNTLVNNTFINDGISMNWWWEHTLTDVVQARVEGNTVNGKPVLFFQHQRNVTVNGGDVGQVILINSSSMHIENLVISNASVAFQLIFSGNNTLVNNTASYNSWKGFSIVNSADNVLINNTASCNTHDGFSLLNSDRNTLINNTASYNGDDGFFMESSMNNAFINNTASRNGEDGFYLIKYSDHNAFINNTASRNTYDGFYLYESTDNMLINNTLINDGISIDGPWLSRLVQARVEGNTVNGKPVLFFQHQRNVTVNGGNVGQVILINSFYIRIENLVISNASVAFQLIFSGNNTLVNNTASSNDQYGFFLHDSANNTFINNTASHNGENGIYLENSMNNTFINNTVTSNYREGFFLHDSVNNTFISNTVSYNNDGFLLKWGNVNNTFINNTVSRNDDNGFSLYGSVNNTFINNTVAYNSWEGFFLLDSTNNTFINNTVSHSYDYGFSIIGESSNNVVKFNDLLFNNGDDIQAYSESPTDVFDYNFWSDHLTPDDDDDGIVDLPYTIDGGAGVIDPHPVTKPYQEYPPFPPRNLQATVGDGRVMLSWEAPVSDGGSPITAYRVYRSTTSGSNYVLIATVSSDATTYTDLGVTNDVTYYYVVHAVNIIGESPASNEVFARLLGLSSSSTISTTINRDTSIQIGVPSFTVGPSLLLLVLWATVMIVRRTRKN